ncbi:uncharacterized protein LOC122312584 [Carya illinoinensis]|uniref:uncharacterized protein LOC122312584 n=1 Tax=Carya illinoinensis TaxID=32201 RepID=UPI001C71A155|nr:uncharacterized protein LOC122312584 [Carya illinoinensis]
MEAPDVLFLQETRLSSRVFDSCKFLLNFPNCLAVGSSGRKGSLALLWGREVDLSILSFSPHHFHAVITDVSFRLGRWFFTTFYGCPETHLRFRSWALLRSLCCPPGEAWLIMGDFNEILYQHEKKGGKPRPARQLLEFRDVLEECSLRDLGFSGPKFTWCNRRAFPSRISECLDHVLVNSSCHVVGEPACEELIQHVWGGAPRRSDLLAVAGLIHASGTQLRLWNRHSFGNVNRQLAQAQRNLQGLIDSDRGEVDADAINLARNDVQRWLERQEIMWRQRSRAVWLKEGDNNTRYFHMKASQRRHKNGIFRIQYDRGQWQDGSRRDRVVLAYFQSLYTSSDLCLNVGSVDFLQPLLGKVTSALNSDLLRDFQAEEVKCALFQMDPISTPGPDGMSPIFFQKYWHVVGPSVTSAVLHALNASSFPSSINCTHISLIPKKKSPSQMGDYRPISLCNVLYKLIAKVLANRLKSILPSIISERQSAFVPGRLISDNILIAYELIHYLRQKRYGKTGYMSLKLDMSKAYDRVEWTFLQSLMDIMEFHPRFVHLIMCCVWSVSYSVLLNGEPKGPIVSSRGLRQGDPLSPYLFLLCTEGFISLLNMARLDRSVGGLKICQGAPTINHLLFADDSLVFCKADIIENRRIQELLGRFEAVSGQKINKEKTTIVFSGNVDVSMRTAIKALWSPSEIQQYEKYLGLPPIVGRSKTRAFESIKQKVWNTPQSWKEKLLSQGGKEAGLGRCPSYTWRGIWEARKRLVAGCMWRIGSGTAVNIWSEQWIPGHKSLLAEGVVVRDDVRMNVVHSLFLPNARAWDIPKLRALFDPNVVNDILKIQLFSGGMDDCRDSLGSPFPEASSRRRPLLLWKHLWKMKVPNKIKIFAWRACQNGLPVGSLLQQKRILADPTYKLCLFAPETVSHALVFCPAVHVFFSTYLPGLCFHHSFSIVDLAMDIIAARKFEDLSVFFSLAWSFWFQRNKFVHEQLVIPPRRSADEALVMVRRFSQIHAPQRDL